jgi:hypothetical protein
MLPEKLSIGGLSDSKYEVMCMPGRHCLPM